MARPVTDETLALIRRWEGKRNQAYRDAAGIWSIGYGHTLGVVPGQAVTDAEADALLQQDLAMAGAAVERLVAVPLSDGQYGALVSFVFNLGAAAFGNSTLLKKLNTGDYAAVPAELQRWVKATDPATGRKQTLPGLVNRRAAEAGLWARGAAVAGNMVEPAAPSVSPHAGTAAAAGGTLGLAAGVAAASPFVGVLERLAEGAPYLVAAAVIAGVAVAAFALLRRRPA